jgi:hypothetical protein
MTTTLDESVLAQEIIIAKSNANPVRNTEISNGAKPDRIA